MGPDILISYSLIYHILAEYYSLYLNNSPVIGNLVNSIIHCPNCKVSTVAHSLIITLLLNWSV